MRVPASAVAVHSPTGTHELKQVEQMAGPVVDGTEWAVLDVSVARYIP